MVMVDDMHWRLASDCALLSRHWDDEHVVYNPAAGDTHLLGDAAVAVLSLLKDQTLGSAALTAAMHAYCSPQEQQDVIALTNAILTDLESLGLIERTCL